MLYKKNMWAKNLVIFLSNRDNFKIVFKICGINLRSTAEVWDVEKAALGLQEQFIAAIQRDLI